MAVVEALLDVHPAEEDVAAGLHQALSGDHALTVVLKLARRDEPLEHRGLGLLQLQEERVLAVDPPSNRAPTSKARIPTLPTPTTLRAKSASSNSSKGTEHQEMFDALHQLLRSYRASLQFDRRVLLDEFELADFARKVVGVGSVGMRAWIALLLGVDGKDPLFLQLKEAEASVLERFIAPSEFQNHGERVVTGQRLMQASSDILLGWMDVERAAFTAKSGTSTYASSRTGRARRKSTG